MNMIRFGTVFSKFIVLGAHGNWIYWLKVTTRLRKLGAAISWSLFYLSHSFESSVAFTFALLKLSQSTLLFFAFLGFSPFWFLAFFLYFFLPPFLPFFLLSFLPFSHLSQGLALDSFSHYVFRCTHLSSHSNKSTVNPNSASSFLTFNLFLKFALI